ncbi:MAG: hypothetical protein JXX29_05675 [Deltaproteobacteria bacterium]|nr:hypothetical protein [Deltaproteobacteria bacterium]MBN2671138.1 hypothetical protein [Deltaproteobacteria bacterium]
MSLQANWETYKGKQILNVCYTTCNSTDEMIKLLEKELQMLKDAGGNSLLLADFRGTTVENEFMDKAKSIGKELEALTDKSAILGITGVKKILLMAYNKVAKGSLKPFDDETAAKDYLVN